MTRHGNDGFDRRPPRRPFDPVGQHPAECAVEPLLPTELVPSDDRTHDAVVGRHADETVVRQLLAAATSAVAIDDLERPDAAAARRAEQSRRQSQDFGGARVTPFNTGSVDERPACRTITGQDRVEQGAESIAGATLGVG